MTIPVLIEPMNGAGFRASTGAPLTLSVEGTTETEALHKLQALLQSRLAQGSKVVLLTVPGVTHPLARFAGQFKDDPDFQDVIEIMKERRQASA
jgi:hypothetical protein